jgi:hypothetical protein
MAEQWGCVKTHSARRMRHPPHSCGLLVIGLVRARFPCTAAKSAGGALILPADHPLAKQAFQNQ